MHSKTHGRPRKRGDPDKYRFADPKGNWGESVDQKIDVGVGSNCIVVPGS